MVASPSGKPPSCPGPAPEGAGPPPASRAQPPPHAGVARRAFRAVTGPSACEASGRLNVVALHGGIDIRGKM